MSYMQHHTIIVTSWDKRLLLHAHAEAQRIFPWVSELSPVVINGYQSFYVPPDGSKEQWDESDAGDKQRTEFKRYLESQRYDDGSTSLKWCEVSFGADHGEAAAVISSSDEPIEDNHESKTS